MYEILIEGEAWDTMIDYAIRDKENWDRKNGGGIQCKNTYKGCMVGALAEYAVIDMITNRKGVSDIKPYGMWERKTGKPYHDQSDVEFLFNNKVYRVEVKGCQPTYPLGQVKPYHVNKYIDEGVDYIMLVSTDINYNNETALCKVYSIASPKTVSEWELKPNLQGNDCHTLDSLLLPH